MDSPLYQGASASLSQPQPVQTPTLSGEASRQAVERGVHALEAAASRFTQIQDFGEDQRIEGLLSSATSQFDEEFTRRATLAPGTEEALYDENGRLHRGHLDTLVKDYAKRIGEIRPGYINPQSRLRADALLQQTQQGLQTRALGKAAEREIQVSRQAYHDNLKTALNRKDYAAARDINNRARQNSIISQNQSDYDDWHYSQLERIEQFNAGLQQDPLSLAAQYEDGLYDDIEPATRRALEKTLQSALRHQATQIPFSAQQRKLIEQGIAVQPRFSRQPGDTEQMVKWREAKANGLLHEHKPQINAAWQEDVYNAPVYKTQAPYNTWKNSLLKTWCDEKTGFGVNSEELSLAADARIADLLCLTSAKDNLDAAEFFNSVDPQDIAPSYYQTWRDKAETWYWTDKGRQQTEGAAAQQYQQKTAQIRHEAYTAYLYWRQSNPQSGYYEQYSQACSLLAASASRMDKQNQVKRDELLFKYAGSHYGDGTQKKSLDALALQQQRHTELRQKRAQSITAAQQAQASTASPTLPAVMAKDIQPIPDEQPGAYLSRQDYEKVLEYYGESPELVGVIPGTGSQRACCRVPVLGWHDGQGVLLTRGARHGQLGRIGRIDGLEVRFLRPPASKLLTPQERKKHMEQKRRQEPQTDSTLLPPYDAQPGLSADGLLPLPSGQEAETALPVSQAGLPGF